MKQGQLPLGVQLSDDATFSSFYAGPNTAVLAAIQRVLRGEGEEHYLYLWGEEGVGCTHLLQAACHESVILGRSACYLPLKNYAILPATALEGLERLSLVCLDNIDAIAGHGVWEEAVFHFFNRLRASHIPLLVADHKAARYLNIKLPDLKSRLSWGTPYQVHALEDNEKLAALQIRAKARGLVLSDEVGRFLLRRCARDMQALYHTLAKLDAASLSAQRRLTIPFIKEVLTV